MLFWGGVFWGGALFGFDLPGLIFLIIKGPNLPVIGLLKIREPLFKTLAKYNNNLYFLGGQMGEKTPP